MDVFLINEEEDAMKKMLALVLAALLALTVVPMAGAEEIKDFVTTKPPPAKWKPSATTILRPLWT